MIELTILNYLNSELSVTAYMEYPEEPPAKFVTIDKTGGSGDANIRRATVAIQSYANSLYEAAELNEAVKTAMLVINRKTNSVSHVELNSDYEFTNSAKKRYRYQAVFDLVYQE